MARSHYVYIVLNVVGTLPVKPVAGFTVKHELISWLADKDTDYFQIWRLPDADKSRPIVEMTDELNSAT